MFRLAKPKKWLLYAPGSRFDRRQSLTWLARGRVKTQAFNLRVESPS
jgi:hypothetical protein